VSGVGYASRVHSLRNKFETLGGNKVRVYTCGCLSGVVLCWEVHS